MHCLSDCIIEPKSSHRISLVTLGGCHHLDGWSSGGGLARVGDCMGSCTFPGRVPKGNSSKLLVSLSYLTCG